jgi:ATP-dependent Clp protease ATP-binding subunit ClpB
VRIELTPAARSLVLAEGYDPAYGARPLRRAVQRLIQDPLAMEILEGRVLPGSLVRADADPASGEMKFTLIQGAGAPESGEPEVAASRSRSRR